MDLEKKDAQQLVEEVAGLSKDEAASRIRFVERKISTLEWDSKRNQIHPARLYQLKMLRAEMELLEEHCQALAA